MAYLSLFKQYLELTDQLADIASKEDLLACARLLAMNVAHYESKYGALPLEELLAMVNADQPNDEQAKLLTKGMENLVRVLGGVVQGLDEKVAH